LSIGLAPDRQLRRTPNLSRGTFVKGSVASFFEVIEPGDAVKSPNALLHGTLDALILKTLAAGPRHGYAIARFIENTTAEAVAIVEGSLYPALYRMERRGWIKSECGTSDLGRRVKFYRLTEAGRDQLVAQTATWHRFATGISRVLLAQ
jgi:PadR family transcriptional regulator